MRLGAEILDDLVVTRAQGPGVDELRAIDLADRLEGSDPPPPPAPFDDDREARRDA